MRKETKRWVAKAENDFRAAEVIAAQAEPLHEVICFHCQQCAEKYLKALLVELRTPPPRTHDLEVLLALLVKTHPALSRLRRGLSVLTRYAVETRYPDEFASKREAVSALRWATRIRTECRKSLGIPPSSAKKAP